MSRGPVAPAGFTVHVGRGSLLVARADLLDALIARGLDAEAGWAGVLAAGHRRAGRGPTASIDLGGTRARLKQMLRGGLAGPLWRHRFAGSGRLLANVQVALEATRRGVVTPGPLALLLVEGPPGLFRGWSAFEEIEGAVDLLERFRSPNPPAEDERRAAMAAVRRMHDAGIHHVDLNLGNLLVRRRDGRAEAFVIDLDRARIGDGPLAFAPRLAALRRLERSWTKNLPAAPPPAWCYELYAGDDAALRDRLLRARARN